MLRRYCVILDKRSYHDTRYFWTLGAALRWQKVAGTGAHVCRWDREQHKYHILFMDIAQNPRPNSRPHHGAEDRLDVQSLLF